MLKAYSSFIRTVFFLCDIFIVCVSWVILYFIRIKNPQGLFDRDILLFKEHLGFLLLVIVIYAASSYFFRLYESKRTVSIFNELADAFKATLLTILALSLVFNLNKEHRYSGAALFFFCLTTFTALCIFRIFLRNCLRMLRSKGYNLRHILIVGTDSLAQETAMRIQLRYDFGLDVVGFLAKDKEDVGSTIGGAKVIGTYKDIITSVAEKGIDHVIFALSQKEHRILMLLLSRISDTIADISVIPDIRYKFFTLRHGVEEFAGLPVIKLREAPLYGWNRIIKRCFDFLFALIMLIACLPLFAAVAIMIKIQSRGPIFYKQDRMGYDGTLFEIIKFRSMKEDAEVKTGAVWAKDDDPRSTRIGKFMRKASIDEIPQLINVLKGEMSLVGPRPERSVFIESFRGKIPLYMLRHKMKAGMTGWAQVNGLRGNTSLEKRIEYDLYYIENWSLWLDIKILFLTIPAIFMGQRYLKRYKKLAQEANNEYGPGW